jgi:hypothetical protein
MVKRTDQGALNRAPFFLPAANVASTTKGHLRVLVNATINCNLVLIHMDLSLEYRLKLVRIYSGILNRCYNPASPAYCWYGARGIKMCERWKFSADAFISDMGPPPDLEHSVDRIDCNGDYDPSNCRWATQEEQNSNTRRNKYIEYAGKKQTIKEWSKEYNLAPPRLSERLRRGWSVERALNTPCALGYEKGRAKHLQASRESWAKSGRDYAARSRAKRSP